MLTIALTDKAESDLQAIHEHYASHSGLKAANEVIFRIFEKLEQLKVFSGMGRPSRFRDRREWVFLRDPFIATYQIRGSQIQILRIQHQRTARASDVF